MVQFQRDYIIVILFVAILHLAAIYLYSNGFLIVSVQLKTQSKCNDPLFTNTLYAQKYPPQRCWTTPITDKAAVFLVDALRYDFAFTEDSGTKLYHNNMPIFEDMMIAYPKQTSKYHFIPDPPTTTNQRVKAMTTGGVPAFIEVSNMFNNEMIEEDNIIQQFKSNGLRTVFAGDSLWVEMFPNMFDNITTGPSLEISDLHSVDKLCDDALHIHMELNDYDVMIAHFLGVDHIGHYYIPDHPVMKDKLIQINDIFARVFDQLPENTLCMVFGDHGVTEEGNHGGSTPEELDAALFIYDKRKRNGGMDDINSVTQVDIVPTLSLALGLPIPYSNTGTPIRNVFLSKEPSLDELQSYVNVLNITTTQILRFLYSNAHENMRSTKWISDIEKSIKEVVEKELSSFDDFEELMELVNQHESLSHSLHEIFVQNNATFNFTLIICGVVIMLLSMIVLTLYVVGYKQFNVSILKIVRGLSVGLIPAVFLRRVMQVNMNKLQQYVFFTSLFAELAFISNYATQFNKLVLDGITLVNTITLDLVLYGIITFFYGFGQYTDSFIKEEKYTSYFISQCILLGLTVVMYCKRSKNNFLPTIMHIILILSISVLHLLPIHYVSMTLLPVILYYITSSWILPVSAVISLIFQYLEPFATSFTGIALPISVYILTTILLIYSYHTKKGPFYYICIIIPFMTTILPVYSSTVFIVLLATIYLMREHEWNELISLYIIFISIYYFFLTGHAFQFSDIQFNAGFIGFPFYSIVCNGVIIISNTFVFPSIAVLAIAAITVTKEDVTKYLRSSIGVMIFFSYQLLSLMIFTYFQSGHLEIFRIFTPKVCFDAIIVIIVDIAIILTYFLLRRSDDLNLHKKQRTE
ncbi:GPI ethanolamine phosphate transferase 3 [Entamoeba marina]